METIKIPDYTQANVVVYGDVMLDRYWYGNTHRVSPEAPVPVVHVRGLQACPGGAGNVALNVVALGGKASLFGLCGKDDAAKTLKEKLTQANVSFYFESVDHLPTTTKLRILSVHQQLLRLDFEEAWHEINQSNLLARCIPSLNSANALILSDYGKGCLVDPQVLITQARSKKIPVIIDPKRTDFEAYRGATIITPNFSEFVAVVGDCPDQSSLCEKGTNLMLNCQLDALLVTQGSKGMTLLQQGAEPFHLPAESKEVYDVTGAGDTVVAMIAASLACKTELKLATHLANTAASIVVSKLGAASVTVPELRNTLYERSEYDFFHLKGGIVDKSELNSLMMRSKDYLEKIVMVSGYFDILNKSHLDFLETAKSFGERLLVVVYDDHLTVNSLAARKTVLAGLKVVDWVTSMTQADLDDFIRTISPDIVVMSQEDKKTGHIGDIEVMEIKKYLASNLCEV